ncbi:MAG: beta-galactosidase [Clostridiaceae bacterium]|nr:beta-galactosidase [Clostridiaceae bacterium]
MKIQRYEPISKKCRELLHGADYNPDQWMKTPEIWDEDMRLMKLAGCNVMSVGIFSWSSLEPEEGRFEFDWLDTILDKMAENKVYAILATPTGSKPAWMSQKYPEILRVQENRQRNLHGQRHNHCFTSPLYREKASIINRKLAERYKDHPALIAWHISNEYGGECHCELCQEAFRSWLKNKYHNDLEGLNHAWWTGFWSHRFNDWSQLESPSPHGENLVHGHNLDWKRFVTDQTIDFYKNEIKPLRELTPDIPVTTNFMGTYTGLNYWKFAKEVDVVSWDSYPSWHNDYDKAWELASDISFVQDINRSLKGGKPFMLMESTPSLVNWQPTCKLKRPGMHLLSSIQALAHGSDTVQYFQWRKGRGSSEKFHGAVVDHCGHENTRVFGDVAQVGLALKKLEDVVGTTVRPEVAIIYDWENRWAIDDAQGFSKDRRNYEQTCKVHYRTFWNKGVPVDVIDMDCDFSNYKLLVAPMLYMVRPGVGERIEEFVKSGGSFVTTYASGYVDENDLCFLGGFPGPLRKVTGIWAEEIDSLYPTDSNGIILPDGCMPGLKREYKAVDFCELIHAETAQTLGVYSKDFYAGRPALTVNSFGQGKAWYMAARFDEGFLTDFYSSLIAQLELKKVLGTELPPGVTAQVRSDGFNEYIFVMNFSEEQRIVDFGEDKAEDMLTGEKGLASVLLKPYGAAVLRRVNC